MDGANNDDYTFKLVKSVKDKEGEYWVIDATPKNSKEVKRSGYYKTTHYVRKDLNFITRSIFFSTDKVTTKFLKVVKLETLNGVITPTYTIMLTKKSGKFDHKTVLTMSDMDNKSKLDDSIFTTRSLEKGL